MIDLKRPPFLKGRKLIGDSGRNALRPGNGKEALRLPSTNSQLNAVQPLRVASLKFPDWTTQAAVLLHNQPI